MSSEIIHSEENGAQMHALISLDQMTTGIMRNEQEMFFSVQKDEEK